MKVKYTAVLKYGSKIEAHFENIAEAAQYGQTLREQGFQIEFDHIAVIQPEQVDTSLH